MKKLKLFFTTVIGLFDEFISRVKANINICMYCDINDHNSWRCLDLIVFAATIPWFAVSIDFGGTKVFWLVETNCLLL